ncbi:unnamed protein product [Parnassius apollo]|uniref:(apollo) hypothetical protein n=1 Tax=Parnassius apollo TaxID=110799 RepID=A0A8S3XS58_PARAO|nr:unnamed protein product [Parnassius apollo]
MDTAKGFVRDSTQYWDGCHMCCRAHEEAVERTLKDLQTCSHVVVGTGGECEMVRVVCKTAVAVAGRGGARAHCWACCCRAVCSCVVVGTGGECEMVLVVCRTAVAVAGRGGGARTAGHAAVALYVVV